MPRKTIDEQSPLRGQDAYWGIIRELGANGGLFSVADITRKTNATTDIVREYVIRLEKAGYIARAGHDGSSVLFCLVRDSRFTPRVRRDGSQVLPTRQDQMWRTMKMLKRFTAQDLAVAASTEQVRVSPVHAQDYIKHLGLAGYVCRCGNGEYALLPTKNTGPLAPYIQRVKQVFDPNLNCVVWRSDHEQ